jgi:hypothetical protein
MSLIASPPKDANPFLSRQPGASGRLRIWDIGVEDVGVEVGVQFSNLLPFSAAECGLGFPVNTPGAETHFVDVPAPLLELRAKENSSSQSGSEIQIASPIISRLTRERS